MEIKDLNTKQEIKLEELRMVIHICNSQQAGNRQDCFEFKARLELKQYNTSQSTAE